MKIKSTVVLNDYERNLLRKATTTCAIGDDFSEVQLMGAFLNKGQRIEGNQLVVLYTEIEKWLVVSLLESDPEHLLKKWKVEDAEKEKKPFYSQLSFRGLAELTATIRKEQAETLSQTCAMLATAIQLLAQSENTEEDN